MEYPKLRPVQFFPVTVEGKRMGCLHDPQRICDKPLIIPWHLVPILTSLDGKHALLDIQAEYTRSCGDLLFHEDLLKFLESLDYYLFLHSKRFSEFKEKVRHEFISSPVRPSFFSGLSYSSDPRLLQKELEGYFTSPDGPGWPDQGEKFNNGLTGIVAPHIELKSGGPCYAWAYSELTQSSTMPELFIILGTCHSGIKGLFSLTDKPFLTPLGEAKCDKKFIGSLKDSCNADIFSEEFLHRSEHTIEFQVLFLQLIWERFGINWPELQICPILCAFTPDCFSEESSDIDIYNAFIEPLKKTISSYDKSVCIIASVDFAHIGPKFGDFRALDRLGRQACFNEDRIMLEMIAQRDQRGFQDNMLQSYDKKRICGYPPLTAMLDILPPSHGKLLNYSHTIVDEQASMVTYASMAFFD